MSAQAGKSSVAGDSWSAGYTNPVVATSQPDPHVLYARGRWYLYSTGGQLGHLPVLASDDLIDWGERILRSRFCHR